MLKVYDEHEHRDFLEQIFLHHIVSLLRGIYLNFSSRCVTTDMLDGCPMRGSVPSCWLESF